MSHTSWEQIDTNECCVKVKALNKFNSSLFGSVYIMKTCVVYIMKTCVVCNLKTMKVLIMGLFPLAS